MDMMNVLGNGLFLGKERRRMATKILIYACSILFLQKELETMCQNVRN
jgi:hypothetical protein